MTPVFNSNNQEIQRQKCEVYTRVMGYLAPVTRYNDGKKSEFYSRKYYKVENENDQFTADFGCCGSKKEESCKDGGCKE